MKSADPVMQDVWRAKEANAKKHGNLAAYVGYLRKQSKRGHPGRRRDFDHYMGKVPDVPAQEGDERI